MSKIGNFFAWLSTQFMKLPTMGTAHRMYVAIGSFLLGLLVSGMFGRSTGILFIAFFCGLMYSHKKLMKPYPNTVLILYAVLFSFGIMLFSVIVPRIVVIACFVIGIVVGIKLRKKYE